VTTTVHQTSAWRSIVVLLATLVSVALTARLGFWQLDRAAQKVALQRVLDERSKLPALSMHELPSSQTEAQNLHHRPVLLQGTWVARATVFLDNRQMNGHPGFFVLTPLMLSSADGASKAVLIQRGWVPRNSAQRTTLPEVLTASGTVQIKGLMAPAPARLFEFDAAASGPIRQNLSLESFAAEMALPLLPFTVVQTEPDSATNDGLLRQWARPGMGVHKHQGYAFQWFSLAVLLAGLSLWFQVLRPFMHARRVPGTPPTDEL
jgi:surfeit locus 1 family protein